jgi:hypothetical protein
MLMQLNPIFPYKTSSKSRTTPTFTGIDVVSWATPMATKKNFKERKKKKDGTGFERFFLILLCA